MNRLQFEDVVDQLARMVMRRHSLGEITATPAVAAWWIGDHRNALRALDTLKHTMHSDALCGWMDCEDMRLAEVMQNIATQALCRDINERVTALRACGVEVTK